ncbi:hypothetical protein ACJIZ3_013459 [Penstemon smallii]|uniref:RING-type domain-containing protein n=1 Tax=Penstemon smallii TaxID=265156 RepID=A0ABD3UR04_9LAMI
MAVEARHVNNLLMNQQQQQQQQKMRFPPNLVINNSFYHESVVPKTSLSGGVFSSTLNIIPPAASRKRCRGGDSMYNINNNNFTSFVGVALADDIMPQIQQHQLEIDALISQHSKKIRLEVEEKQKQQARLIAARAMGEGVLMKKLKERDEEIERMGKLNLVLQERVKSLFVENQLWRDLAQSNEATANSLRTNLEQVLLLHVEEEEEEEEDAESCCQEEILQSKRYYCCCKRCGERESCVLLLPCRHLCLCNVCGTGSHKLQTCPVCNSTMTATLHLNTSSSS